MSLVRENTWNLDILLKHRECFFAKVVNSLNLNIENIAIFGGKKMSFSKSVSYIKLSQISENGTGKIPSQTEKIQGKHRKFAIRFGNPLYAVLTR